MIERYVEVPEGYLYSQTRGAGQDVLLLGAGACDLRLWESTVTWLAPLARVTTFDYRDMGLSSRATAAYAEADDIAAVLDAAGAETAVLIGVSDGARRALGFAHRHPERVRRVVAVGGASAVPGPDPQEAAAWAVMAAHFEHIVRLGAEAGLPARAAADIDGWGAALDRDGQRKLIDLQLANAYWMELDESLGADLDPPVNTRFAELTVPVDAVVGDRDFEGTRLWARRLAAQAPAATLTEIPDSDHFPMLSAPAAFERIVRAALDA